MSAAIAGSGSSAHPVTKSGSSALEEGWFASEELDSRRRSSIRQASTRPARVDVATSTEQAHEADAANALPHTSLADPGKSRARSPRHEGSTPLGDWTAATLCPSCRGHGRGARHQEGPGRPACSS